MQNYLLIGLLSLTIQNGFGQKDYSLYWLNDTLSVADLLQPIADTVYQSSQFGDNFYVVLQFEAIPSWRDKEQFRQQGIHLVGYVPNFAYLAIVPKGIDWKKIPHLRGLFLYTPKAKIAANAYKYFHSGVHSIEKDSFQLSFYPFQSVASTTLAHALAAKGATIESVHKSFVQARIETAQLLDIASIPAIQYIASIAGAPRHEGGVGRAQQRANWLGRGPGIGLNGEGVVLAIGDDGKLNHLDFAGRVFDHTLEDRGTHGDMTAGLAIGAGNLDPQAMGMASGAFLHLYPIDRYEHIQQAIDNYQQLGTVITSTSFWEGCGGVYTAAARDLDLQVNHSISLLHCFSAGNSGDENCYTAYGAIVNPEGLHYGNITGGRKASKHAIAVGNLTYDDQLAFDSSRGPAADGRIKPDLSAPGQGQLTTTEDNRYQLSSGTSAAAPTVAGAAALLYQSYRTLHGSVDPPSALIKAILLNTADDLGRKGPDYEFGWGRPHLGRALKSLEKDPIIAGAVNHQERNEHTIMVPAGVSRMRVMLYWNDPAGLPMNTKALVNDLNMQIIGPDGSTFLPWVLSTYPHLDSLQRPARPGIDEVNNMEQIQLEQVVSGEYHIYVDGKLVPDGPQVYFLSICYEEEPLAWAYPLGGEGLVPGAVETLRWDAIDEDQPFAIAYSKDNLNSWINIATQIPGQQKWYDWEIPSGLNQPIYLRLRQGAQAIISQEAIAVLPQPKVSFLPLDQQQVSIYWDPIVGANQYEIYKMGYQYMEKIAVTQDTFIHLPTFIGEQAWYSIAPVSEEGISGRRNKAIFYEHYACEFHLNLSFIFDQYPVENRWLIQSPDGQIWASGGPYPNSFYGSASKQIPLCLPSGCYELVVFDAYQDGMCCLNGQGQFVLTLADGRVLVTGGVFGAQQSLPFCLDESLLPLLSGTIAVAKPPSCHSSEDGSLAVQIEAAGTLPIQYLWNTGDTTAQIINLGEGIYSVTISQGGAHIVLSKNLKGPAPLHVELHGSSPLCSGEASGWLDVMVSGGMAPYSYTLNGQEQLVALDLDRLEAGEYRLEVLDANGCLAIAATNLLAPDSLQLISSMKEDDGRGYRRLEVSVLGGLGPYHFGWSNGVIGPTLENPSPGQYSVSVVDDNGCLGSLDIQVFPPVDVCPSLAKSAYHEWIESVEIDTISFRSGNNAGFGDFTSMPILLDAGRGYSIKIHPGFRAVPFNEYFRAWVDFNRDNDFTDPGEEILNLESWAENIETQLFIGTAIPSGTLRLRIAMQYGQLPTPCGAFAYGEVEDFLLQVNNQNLETLPTATYFSDTTLSRLVVFPNPVKEAILNITLNLEEEELANVLLFDRYGRIVYQDKRKGLKNEQMIKLDIGQWEKGIYWILIINEEGVLLESKSVLIQSERFNLMSLDD
ncbi:MAG: S8 family serine peptidase [Saprospiraceae bacterium]